MWKQPAFSYHPEEKLGLTTDNKKKCSKTMSLKISVESFCVLKRSLDEKVKDFIPQLVLMGTFQSC